MKGLYVMLFGTAQYLVEWDGQKAVDWIKLF